MDSNKKIIECDLCVELPVKVGNCALLFDSSKLKRRITPNGPVLEGLIRTGIVEKICGNEIHTSDVIYVVSHEKRTIPTVE